MKSLIQTTAAVLILSASVGTATAQSTSYYGPGGSYAGSSNTSINTTSYYGPGGGYLGSARRN